MNRFFKIFQSGYTLSMSKYDEMKKIRDEVLILKESPLYEFRIKERNFPVIGEGSHDAKIMFVGEAPGKNEAETGKPFCGRSGKMLDELLLSISAPRESVYVTNIVKDRPPENRDPSPEEIELYGPFLNRQIEIIKPNVVATLGRFSMSYIFNLFEIIEMAPVISKVHGLVFETDTKYGKIVVVPLYHPAVAIYNSNSKETLLKDFQILKKYLN